MGSDAEGRLIAVTSQSENRDPRLVLRDGTVANVRTAGAADLTALRLFFHGLSPESRYRRFCTAGDPPAQVLERLVASADPAVGLTLLAERLLGGKPAIVAVASYAAGPPGSAEVSFAVADAFQGRGIAMALLERLAADAAGAGISTFTASTLADNATMLSVFHDSGFALRSRTDGGMVETEMSLSRSGHAAEAASEREREATAASLRPLLAPKAVAVIGASRSPSNIGRRVLDAIRSGGFAGPVFPVNPRAEAIDGLQVLKSARDLPPGVDLAVVAVPAAAVLGVVDDCAAAGVRSLVVISAGFAETGAEGRALQHELAERVRGYGMRMIGPNCMGVLNAAPGVRLNASFSPVFPPGGHIGLLSQSGALGLAILQLAEDRQLGLSTFLSVGNKADVSGNDLLQYWESDPQTRVILLYLESFGNPRRFGRLARRVARTKPIVVVKAGRTAAGARAASSHTAAMAANDVAVDALFRQSGAIRADTLHEMLDLAACLDAQPLPRGSRVAIVTNAGGPGILAADACAAGGLVITAFEQATVERLAQALPAMAAPVNPLDLIASAGPDEYRRAIQIVLTADEVDALLVIFTPVDPAGAGATIGAITRGITDARSQGASGKPVLACVLAETDGSAGLVAGDERIPSFSFPEDAARALAKVTAYGAWRRRPASHYSTFKDLRMDAARAACRAAVEARGEGWLSDQEVRTVLESFGIPLIPAIVVASPDEAAAAAARLGYPLAAKLSSTAVQHKTDVAGVRLGLAGEADVRRATAELLAIPVGRVPAKVLLQPMVTGGVELMIGVVSDRLFGPLIGFGLGGVHVEILGDVQFRAAPLSDQDADDLLHGIRGFRLLEGYRGHPPGDVAALRDLLLRVSRLAEELPEVTELDLNPVMALEPGKGCRVVDARVRVAPARPPANPAVETGSR